jgi:lipoprotein-anchoring transpeptidase ErfK/SrfK
MKHSNKQSGCLRGAGLVAVVALALLLLLTVSVWAAWGTGAYARVLHLGNWGSTLQASLTATPTKTPRPVTPEPTGVPVELTIVTPELATATPVPTATQQPESVTTADPMPTRLAEVVEQFGIDPSRRFIVVDTATQQMLIWDPGKPVRDIPVSTGDESRGYRTPAWYGLVGKYVGTFNAHGVYADEGWYLFEDAGSILIHGAPYQLADGVKVYEDMEALGSYPASRGCIRLRPEDALWFTEWDPQGVPLVILPRNAG